jgi:phage baseplate assembly protein V
MIRYGNISEVDPSKGRARVHFQEDDIVSDWLPISMPTTLGNKFEFWPEVNMFVWCVMDENAEDGVIGGALYDDGNTPPVGEQDKSVITFKDGTKVVYDRANSELTIECVGAVIVKCTKATVEASEFVKLDSPTVEVTGNLDVAGGLSAAGNIETQGNIDASGSVEAGGQVRALAGTVGQVSLSTHTHPTPAGLSSAPTPGS